MKKSYPDTKDVDKISEFIKHGADPMLKDDDGITLISQMDFSKIDIRKKLKDYATTKENPNLLFLLNNIENITNLEEDKTAAMNNNTMGLKY